jgi:hypothetical protein
MFSIAIVVHDMHHHRNRISCRALLKPVWVVLQHPVQLFFQALLPAAGWIRHVFQQLIEAAAGME